MNINNTILKNFPGHMIAYVMPRQIGKKIIGHLKVGGKKLNLSQHDNPPNILCECGIDPDKEFKNITLVRV